MIKIPVSIMEKMVSHCSSELPIESCGILAGQDNTVTHIYLMENIVNSPESFLMDPKNSFKFLET
jgi:proteasome lid subunit RPN8/RPN11